MNFLIVACIMKWRMGEEKDISLKKNSFSNI